MRYMLRTDLVPGREYGDIVWYDEMKVDRLIVDGFDKKDHILVYNIQYNCYIKYHKNMFVKIEEQRPEQLRMDI